MMPALALLALLSPSSAAGSPPDEKIPALLISGANNHDWEWSTPVLEEILEETGRFSVDVTYEPAKVLADAAALEKYRVFVLDYNGPSWGDAANANFLAAVRGGTGVAVIHAADNAFPGWVEYEKLVGHLWREGTGHGRFHEFDVKITDRDHPITRDLPDLLAHPDELYHKLVHMHEAPIRVLATAFSSKESGGTGQDEPMIMVREYGKGRMFHTALGHVWKGVEDSHVSFHDPQFRAVVARGTEWAATGEVTIPATFPNRLTPEEEQLGFRLLFDGKSTESWRGFKQESFPAQGWEVVDGALRCAPRGRGGDIITKEQYGDFDLRFEWAVSRGANSGVMFRASEGYETAWRTGPEFQIFDDRPGPDAARSPTSAGSLYALYPPEGKTLKPTGEFNTSRIVLHDGHLEHWVNGVKVLECELGSDDWKQRVGASKFAEYSDFGALERGHIVLQDHGAEVWFRTIRIREL